MIKQEYDIEYRQVGKPKKWIWDKELDGHHLSAVLNNRFLEKNVTVYHFLTTTDL